MVAIKTKARRARTHEPLGAHGSARLAVGPQRAAEGRYI